MRRGRWDPDELDDDYSHPDGDGWERDDSGDDGWMGDDTDETAMECPYCGEEMYDDSPRCPACGRYLSSEDAPTAKKPAWIMITAVVLVIIVLSWMASFC